MFSVPAESYDRFMGLYSSQLSAPFCDLVGVRAGQRVLDVGCGPGALTVELAARLGADAVAAVDPSESFVAAARARNLGVDVRQSPAEELPFADGSFDAAVAQLVVHFMADPLAGVAEMRRVTRTGGVVAASVWDHGGGQGPLSPLWAAAREVDPTATGEHRRVGANKGELARLFGQAGLREVEETTLPVQVEYASFEEWWEPFTYGVGPVGVYVDDLAEGQRHELREACRARFGEPPFAVSARAWVVRGLA